MKKTLLYIALIFISSCTKDLPFNEHDFKKGIVLNSFVSVGKPMRVQLAETFAPTQDGNLHFLSDAIVTLLDSAGNFIEFLNKDTGNGYFVSNTIAMPSTVYSIEAFEPSKLYECSATTRTPNSRPSVIVDTSTIFYQGNPNFFQFSIRLSDKPQEDNYYLFYCIRNYYSYEYSSAGQKIDSIFKSEKLDIATNNYWFVRNNNLQFSKKELLLVDDEFKGLVANFNFGTFISGLSANNERTVSITLNISSLSKERYLYTSSLNEYLFYQSDPFAQNTSVYSNIKNGVGIFASDFPEEIEFGF